MLIPAMSGGRFVFPMPQGVTSIAATDFSSNVCTLKMNPTSTAGEAQLTGAVVTITPSADSDKIVLPPVAQCTGLVLYLINIHASHELDLEYVNSSGSVAALDLAASVIDNDEIALCACDGSKWYAMVTTAT